MNDSVLHTFYLLGLNDFGYQSLQGLIFILAEIVI